MRLYPEKIARNTFSVVWSCGTGDSSLVKVGEHRWNQAHSCRPKQEWLNTVDGDLKAFQLSSDQADDQSTRRNRSKRTPLLNETESKHEAEEVSLIFAASGGWDLHSPCHLPN